MNAGRRLTTDVLVSGGGMAGLCVALARVVLERARQAGGPVVRAATLDDLAVQMRAWGLPPIEALKTLDAYNAAVIAERGELLHPPRRGNPFPVLQPPFSAALVRSGITFTCGGLRCDLDMRVLRRARSVSTRPAATWAASAPTPTSAAWPRRW